jgi:hypothetical protein
MEMILKIRPFKVLTVRLLLILSLTANCSIDNKQPDNIAPTNCLTDITVHKNMVENEDTDTDTTEEEDILEEGIIKNTLICDSLTTNKRLTLAYSNNKTIEAISAKECKTQNTLGDKYKLNLYTTNDNLPEFIRRQQQISPLCQYFYKLSVLGDEHNLNFYTDDTFNTCLKDFGLHQEQIEYINQASSVVYTPLHLHEFDSSHLSEQAISHNFEKWCHIDEDEGMIIQNPTNQHIFLTDGLISCVAITVITPYKTLFAHLSGWDPDAPKSSYESLTALFTDNFPEKDLSHAKVIVSSCFYSENFVRVYNLLFNVGFRNFLFDIQPGISHEGDDHTGCAYSYKLTALNSQLQQLGQKSVFEINNRSELQSLIKYIRDNHLIKLVKSLIVNAKTGELYSIVIPETDKPDSPDVIAHSNDGESDIINKLIQTKDLCTRCKEQRFKTPVISS